MSHGGGIFSSLIREEKPYWWGALIVLILIFIIHFCVVALPLDFSSPGIAFERILRGLKSAWFYGWGSIFVVLDIAVLMFGIFALIKVWPIKMHLSIFEKPSQMAHGKSEVVHAPKDVQVTRAWLAVLAKAKTGTPENMRLAIMDGDALVDQVLKRAKYEGDHMADRLSLIDPERIKSLERVWDAHRLRNQLVHTPGVKLTVEEVKDALTAYRDFLVEFGVL